MRGFSTLTICRRAAVRASWICEGALSEVEEGRLVPEAGARQSSDG